MTKRNVILIGVILIGDSYLLIPIFLILLLVPASKKWPAPGTQEYIFIEEYT